MKIGLLGLIMSDWTDVTYEKVRFAAELGFHGLGAHLTVPAETVAPTTIATVKSVIADQNLAFLQVWGAYPCIITPDEGVRKAGVAQVREIIKLTAKLGVPAAGVRPTSLNPRGDWWPHPDNFSPQAEDRFVHSMREILTTADDYGINIVLEVHQTTLLNSPQKIVEIIQRIGSPRVKVNIDPVNFVTDLQTAFHAAPMIDAFFAACAPYMDTVHVKDFYLEDRFTLHIAETVIGTGIMDLDTVLRRAYQAQPNGYVVIEHLPVNLIPLAKRNLTERIKALGIPIG